MLNISSIILVIAPWAASRPLIRRVYLYGSRVRGDVRAASDIDIAIELDPDECRQRQADAGAAWETASDAWREELQACIPFPVDLRLYRGDLTPVVKAALERSHVLAYESETSRRRWMDSFHKKRAPRCRELVGH